MTSLGSTSHGPRGLNSTGLNSTSHVSTGLGSTGLGSTGLGSTGLGSTGQPGGGPRSLAERQAELVAALTSGAPVPDGFDGRLVEIARVALLRKRAGEVARQWPLTAAAFGRGWTNQFAGWAATRPTQGSLRDGWDLARDLAARNALPVSAGEELATREALWRYDGASAPRPRRAPALRRAAGSVVLQIAGRVRTWRPAG
jgi:hypothetical protein